MTNYVDVYLYSMYGHPVDLNICLVSIWV
jgi:hypothetical protein